MYAEIVLDLPGMGDEVGSVLERELRVFPSLSKIAQMWKALGVDVTAFHVVAAEAARGNDDQGKRFAELHMAGWWEAEQVFVEDELFTVDFRLSPTGLDGQPVGLDSLLVTTALTRSDELDEVGSDSIVIVMSNRPTVAPAVTHARGVPVMIAGTVVPDPSLSHARIDPEWVMQWTNRMTDTEIDRIELRNGRPWRDGIAVCTPYRGIEGRDETLATMPSFAKSVALFDPETFSITSGSTTADHDASTPEAPGIATVVQRLGFGELVHVDVIDASQDAVDTSAVAALYRYAVDNPDASIIVASTRPALIAATGDLATYAVPNQRRVLRLCLPEREVSFDETAFATSSAACRVVIESSLSEPLFAEADAGLDAPTEVRSPILTLWANPNTAKSDVAEWRNSTQRKFLMMGADVAEATPADSSDGPVLPVSLGGCTDFAARKPTLRPGCVLEGILSPDGDRWIIVSDPIERRRKPRTESAPVTEPAHAASTAPDGAAPAPAHVAEAA